MSSSGKYADNTVYVKSSGLWVPKGLASANGIATLDGSGTIPIGQIPSGVGGAVGYIAPVRAVSDVDIVLSGLQTIHSVALIDGDRVGVIGQTSAWFNGVYIAHAGAWTRSTDLDTAPKFINGMIIPVGSEDIAYAGELLRYTNVGAITLGVTNLTFRTLNTTNRRYPVPAAQWYWRLDETGSLVNSGTQDTAAMVITGGTVLSTLAIDASGQDSVLGTGALFQFGNPSTSYASAASSGLLTNPQSVSISMWVYINGFNNLGTNLLFGRMNGGGTYSFYVGIDTAKKIVFFLKASGSTTTSSDLVLDPGTPYFVECSYDGSFQRITVNGVEVTSAGGSPNSGNIDFSGSATGPWFLFNNPTSPSTSLSASAILEDVVVEPRTFTYRARYHRGLGRYARR